MRKQLDSITRKYAAEEVNFKHCGSVVIDSENGCLRFLDKKAAVEHVITCEKAGVNYRILFTSQCRKFV